MLVQVHVSRKEICLKAFKLFIYKFENLQKDSRLKIVIFMKLFQQGGFDFTVVRVKILILSPEFLLPPLYPDYLF